MNALPLPRTALHCLLTGGLVFAALGTAGCSQVLQAALKQDAAAPKEQTTVTFYKDEARTLPATSFVAGERIFVRVKSPETIGALATGNPQVLQLEVTTPAYGSGLSYYQPQPSADELKGHTFDFPLIAPSLSNRHLAFVTDYFKAVPRGAHKFTVRVGWKGQGVGELSIDLTNGAQAYDEMLVETEKALLAENDKVPLPKPELVDPKLAARIKKVLEGDLTDWKFYKVILTSRDWALQRDEDTKVLTHRLYWFHALVKDKATGRCYLDPTLSVQEDHVAGGRFGSMHQGPSNAMERRLQMSCARFEKEPSSRVGGSGRR